MKYTLSKGLDNNPDARKIRQSVFVEEQGFEYEFDDIDETALHLVLYDKNDKPCATGRLFFYDDGCMKIGRIAVMKEYRGMSLGSKVIGILEEKAANLGANHIELSAQIQAKGFYKKLGYTETGEIYKEEFCPHIKMFKDIK